VLVNELFNHRPRSLRANSPIAGGAVSTGDPGKEQLQVVIDLRDCANRRASRLDRVDLFYGDGRGNSFDEIRLRLVHPLQELPGVWTKRFDVTSLAFSVKRVESKAGLAAAARSGNDDQPPEWEVDIDTSEVILTRATDADDRRHRPPYDEKSRRRAVFLNIFELFGTQKDTLAHDFA
jgi:hypothetical protein